MVIMKSKSLYLITLFILIMAITGCANSSENEVKQLKTDSPDKTNLSTISEEPVIEDQAAEKPIEVDKGLFSVSVTLPASMFEGESIDDVIARAKEDGVGEATINADGSVTYKMSKSAHNKIMKEMEDGVLEYVKEIKESGDYVSIKDVTHNKSFSEFTLAVDQELYENSFDGFVSMGVGMMAMYYQLFEVLILKTIK